MEAASFAASSLNHYSSLLETLRVKQVAKCS